MRLLLVEDDQNLSDAIAEQLQKEGYITDCCYDGETALHYALNPEYGYDIVLLDRMLPIIDGLTVLKAMRQKQIFTPVLILTGLGELEDKIEGLDCGADDFEADGDCFTIYTDPDDFNAVADALAKKGYTFVSAQIEMVPGEYKKLDNPDDITNMEKMLDIFEDDDDVQNVWHNWDRD